MVYSSSDIEMPEPRMSSSSATACYARAARSQVASRDMCVVVLRMCAYPLDIASITVALQRWVVGAQFGCEAPCPHVRNLRRRAAISRRP